MWERYIFSCVSKTLIPKLSWTLRYGSCLNSVRHSSINTLEIWDSCVVAVNQSWVTTDWDQLILKDGDEFALIPPVSGGWTLSENRDSLSMIGSGLTWIVHCLFVSVLEVILKLSLGVCRYLCRPGSSTASTFDSSVDYLVDLIYIINHRFDERVSIQQCLLRAVGLLRMLVLNKIPHNYISR
jgi:sulfur carrier protein ThiS